MTKVYNVGGMTCGGCAKSVATAITKAAPDAAVEVDLAAGKVTVDAKVTAETVRTAVEGAGFDFLGSAA